MQKSDTPCTTHWSRIHQVLRPYAPVILVQPTHHMLPDHEESATRRNEEIIRQHALGNSERSPDAARNVGAVAASTDKGRPSAREGRREWLSRGRCGGEANAMGGTAVATWNNKQETDTSHPDPRLVSIKRQRWNAQQIRLSVSHSHHCFDSDAPFSSVRWSGGWGRSASTRAGNGRVPTMIGTVVEVSKSCHPSPLAPVSVTTWLLSEKSEH